MKGGVHSKTSRRGDAASVISRVSIVLLTGLVLLFVFQNLHTVSISFLAWQARASVATVGLGFLLAGLLAGFGGRIARRMSKTGRLPAASNDNQVTRGGDPRESVA